MPRATMDLGPMILPALSDAVAYEPWQRESATLDFHSKPQRSQETRRWKTTMMRSRSIPMMPTMKTTTNI